MNLVCPFCSLRPATMKLPVNPIEADSHLADVCTHCLKDVEATVRAVAALRSAGYGLKPLETDV